MTDFTHACQQDVADFHRALEIPVGSTPKIRRPELRAALIMEEAVETCEALTGKGITWEYAGKRRFGSRRKRLAKVIDGLCDVLVVVYGTAVELGVDLGPFWEEVHRTNMAKKGGPTRADGKKLKPPGWKAPDIEGILKRMLVPVGDLPGQPDEPY